MSKKPKLAEYGDFQTPPGLARAVCAIVAKQGIVPAALLEPTCGLGSLLFAGLDVFEDATQAVGMEINPKYIERATEVSRSRPDAKKVRIVQADVFQTDWKSVIAELPEPVLVIGNLPWVTNTELSSMGSRNAPKKSNFQNHAGLAAITGKANFDISEWMLIQLLHAMHGRRGMIAMLCKTAVARKALCYGWRKKMGLGASTIHRIDADLHFGAAVDAALLITQFSPGSKSVEAAVYSGLNCAVAEATIGFDGRQLLADRIAYQCWKHLCGEEVIKWRSGIKHDCAKVMELVREGKKYRNGLGELVELEDTHIYPMLKSSHVASAAVADKNRFMIVTQRTTGDVTGQISTTAPRTWDYLVCHAELLDRRRSSIYQNRPPFSMFGIGEYSFAPWKVAISGFYKKLAFSVIGQSQDKPIVLDDTCYFLPCQTREQADFLAMLLNSPPAQDFYRAFVFWDAKRPITAELLRKLDLRLLSRELGTEATFDTLCQKPTRQLLLWQE
jgi:hypothetical protein